jgi:hypothetical protein
MTIPLAHGGVGGAVLEAAFALLIVAIALAAWLGARKDDEKSDGDQT